MDWSNLDEPILNIGSKHTKFPWTLRNAYESVVCFGGLGSGKTSGSGRTLALKLFEKGFGGLILTVKKDEKDAFVEYAKLTGREDDIYILDEHGQHRFNILEYLSSEANGGGSYTPNIVDVLKTVLKATSEERGANEEFWQKSLEITLTHLIDLSKLVWGKVTATRLYELVQSLPIEGQEMDKGSIFSVAFNSAREKIIERVRSFEAQYNETELDYLIESDTYEQLLYEAHPIVREFKLMDSFFLDSFAKLATKTRSIVTFTLTNFLFKLLQEPIYSLFGSGNTTIPPELSAEAKIIIIHVPIKEYQEAGRICQIAYKYIWQKSMERREIKPDTRGVLLYADESHFLLHEKDLDFATTSRGARICTIYLTQSIANYYAAIGGNQAVNRVKGFLGTMGTHIYHNNNDMETNQFASSIIGKVYQAHYGESEQYGDRYSRSDSKSYKLAPLIEPEFFSTLRTGSEANNYEVDALIVCQRPLFANFNVCKAIFSQVWQPDQTKIEHLRKKKEAI